MPILYINTTQENRSLTRLLKIFRSARIFNILIILTNKHNCGTAIFRCKNCLTIEFFVDIGIFIEQHGVQRTRQISTRHADSMIGMLVTRCILNLNIHPFSSYYIQFFRNPRANATHMNMQLVLRTTLF
ncbi:hypothetical protein WT08_28070 [Burkholderia sp. MSMB1552]|nr:hypothetical protein WT08_28070 [Burkholderia sp. MSMB1552]KWZ46932.1 hypothetical protein WS92_29770 [Burkholderia sp. MSMB1588]